jgi:hypothetical protein
MSPQSTSTALRHRAAALRSLASAIEATPAMSLERFAGDDTWRGPRPLLCHNILVANLAQLHAAADDLLSHAWRLERQARELDMAAAAVRAVGSQAV